MPFKSVRSLDEFLKAVGITEDDLKKYALEFAPGFGILTDSIYKKEKIGHVADSGGPIKTETVFWVEGEKAYICSAERPDNTDGATKDSDYPTVGDALTAIKNSAKAGILTYRYTTEQAEAAKKRAAEEKQKD